jgi:hypothetical protein
VPGNDKAKGNGRRAGARNRDYFYFYRADRGWFTKVTIGGCLKFVALEYDNGDRMRDCDTPVAELKAASHRSREAAKATPASEASDAGDPQTLAANRFGTGGPV